MKKNAEKQITDSIIKKAVKNRDTAIFTHSINLGDKSAEIIVKPYMPIENYMELINNIVNGCVNAGEYVPSLRDLSVKSQIIESCTNISANDLSLVHKFICYYPEIAEQIVKDLEKVFPNLNRDINDAVNFEIQKFLNTSSFDLVANKIVNILNTLENKLANIPESDITAFINYISKNKPETLNEVLNFKKEK